MKGKKLFKMSLTREVFYMNQAILGIDISKRKFYVAGKPWQSIFIKPATQSAL